MSLFNFINKYINKKGKNSYNNKIYKKIKTEFIYLFFNLGTRQIL